MIDYVIRDCGYGEFLPLIVVTATQEELYRGDRLKSFEEAAAKAKSIWETNGTGNVTRFRDQHGLNPETKEDLRAALIEWSKLSPPEMGVAKIHDYQAGGGDISALVLAARSFTNDNGEQLPDSPDSVMELLDFMRKALIPDE